MQTLQLTVNITTNGPHYMGPDGYAEEVNQIRRVMRHHFACLKDAKSIATRITLDDREVGANILLHVDFDDDPIDYINLTDEVHSLFGVLYDRLIGYGDRNQGVWGVSVRVLVDRYNEERDLWRGWLNGEGNYLHGSLLEPNYRLGDLPDDYAEEED